MTMFPRRLLPLNRTGPVTPSKEVLSSALMNKLSQILFLRGTKERSLIALKHYNGAIVAKNTLLLQKMPSRTTNTHNGVANDLTKRAASLSLLPLLLQAAAVLEAAGLVIAVRNMRP